MGRTPHYLEPHHLPLLHLPAAAEPIIMLTAAQVALAAAHLQRAAVSHILAAQVTHHLLRLLKVIVEVTRGLLVPSPQAAAAAQALREEQAQVLNQAQAAQAVLTQEQTMQAAVVVAAPHKAQHLALGDLAVVGPGQRQPQVMALREQLIEAEVVVVAQTIPAMLAAAAVLAL